MALSKVTSEAFEVMPPEYALMYTKLVRHLTEIQGVLLADEKREDIFATLDLIESSVQEAITFIKTVEAWMMNPPLIIEGSKFNPGNPFFEIPEEDIAKAKSIQYQYIKTNSAIYYDETQISSEYGTAV